MNNTENIIPKLVGSLPGFERREEGIRYKEDVSRFYNSLMQLAHGGDEIELSFKVSKKDIVLLVLGQEVRVDTVIESPDFIMSNYKLVVKDFVNNKMATEHEEEEE